MFAIIQIISFFLGATAGWYGRKYVEKIRGVGRSVFGKKKG